MLLNLDEQIKSQKLPFAFVFGYVNLLNAHLLPFTIMLATALISIRLIRQSKKKIERRGNLCMRFKRSRRDVKYAVTTIVFNVSYIVLRLPLVVVSIYGYTNVASTNLVQFILLLYFMNSSFSFMVHLVSNSLFRQEFLLMIKANRSPRFQPTINYSRTKTTF